MLQTLRLEETKEYEELSKKCKNPIVLPQDLRQRRLCIVGEALGREEEEQGTYFVGKAGFLLDKLLKEIGIFRSQVHITNVIKVRPPENKLHRLYELGLTVEDFLPLLKLELETVNPKIILAAGATSLLALTGEEGILKKRGSVYSCSLTDSDYPVFATLHPSYLQRGQMHLYPYVRHDMKQWAEQGYDVKREQESNYEAITDPSLTVALDYLEEINSSSTETCFDIETVGHEKITCVGWSKSANSGICIPFRHNGLKLRWTEQEQILLVKAMQKIFQNPNIVKIAQNMHYDVHFLLPLLGFPREPIFDTMYAHALIHPDSRHDLGFLTSIYTNMTYHKDEFQDWEQKKLPHDKTLWEYNIKDIITTHRVYHKELKDLESLNLLNFFLGYTMPFRRVLFEMEHRGIRIDVEKRDSWRKTLEEEALPDVLWHISELAGRELNPNSSKQLGEFLTLLGLPVPKTDKGNYTVKEEVLEDLSARFPDYRRFLNLILCARVMKAKDIGTYLSAPLSDANRMHCSYGTTVTGRLSSKASIKGLGSNLQNQPKKFRVLFLPEEGHVFKDADLRQAEAMAMAYLMRSDKLKAIFHNNKKIHKVVGGWIYDCDPETLSPEQYLTAKRIVHASNYSLGVIKLARLINKTVAEAKEIRAKYAQVVPELARYHQEIDAKIQTERKLVTPYGRTRVFTGRLDKDTFRSGYAQIPQSTVVETINIGTLGFWLCKPKEVYIATQTHDSILVSTPPELEKEVDRLLKLHLEKYREIEIKSEKFTIPLDIDSAKENWLGA